MSATAVPITVGVQLGHAAVQLVCERAGIDALHIKGPAVDPRLERPCASTDADVLVRPGQQDRLIAELVRHGWRVVTGFEDGSAFHHAAALWHTYLGYVDVHRIFPGFEVPASEAFDILWADRGQTEIAHRDCSVPSLTAQRVMLVLHTARGGRGTDLERAWHDATQAERDEMAVLVDRLQARVAFDIALGRLDTNLDAASHDLWQLYATGRQSDRWAEWGGSLPGRVRRPRQAARVLLDAEAEPGPPGDGIGSHPHQA